jgi:hypothetical protein
MIKLYTRHVCYRNMTIQAYWWNSTDEHSSCKKFVLRNIPHTNDLWLPIQLTNIALALTNVWTFYPASVSQVSADCPVNSPTSQTALLDHILLLQLNWTGIIIVSNQQLHLLLTLCKEIKRVTGKCRNVFELCNFLFNLHKKDLFLSIFKNVLTKLFLIKE